jgi:hypothetical protein
VNNTIRKSIFETERLSSPPIMTEAGGPGTSKLKALADPRSIEEHHWSNLVRFLFLNTGKRTSIGICSLAGGGSTAGLVGRLCTRATVYLNSTVLLIEGYDGRPSLAESFGVPLAPGLGDLLMSPAEHMYRCIHRTQCPRLWMIPFGRPLPPSEYREFEQRCRDLYAALPAALRYIVVALPPIRRRGDVPLLCSAADRIVLAVRPRSVASREIRTATQRLSAINAKVAGVLWADNRSSEVEITR